MNTYLTQLSAATRSSTSNMPTRPFPYTLIIDIFLYLMYLPGFPQLQPTRMTQGSQTSRFIWTELMYIAIGQWCFIQAHCSSNVLCAGKMSSMYCVKGAVCSRLWFQWWLGSRRFVIPASSEWAEVTEDTEDSQKYPVHYTNTFAPVMRRVLLVSRRGEPALLFRYFSRPIGARISVQMYYF
ncbi:hypothetical protein B0T19DRAFT_415726 [Cercophora scortea]|uniref:Uncharacterized protein n=1 Tax=Cercophora scortea TaxID=314031 RepID=A0AAE0IWQ6_9PEZI|nr:hypothetical protein B0T19DRAFT_415726 [Cercophora scortea]